MNMKQKERHETDSGYLKLIFKIQFFSEPQKYSSFLSLIPSYLLKITKFLVKISQFEF